MGEGLGLILALCVAKEGWRPGLLELQGWPCLSIKTSSKLASVQKFTALIAWMLWRDLAQSWINFRPKGRHKGGGGITSLAMQGKFLALATQD